MRMLPPADVLRMFCPHGPASIRKVGVAGAPSIRSLSHYSDREER